MPKPTKTELKEREKAKEASRAYYKRVIRYERACPFCDGLLSPDEGSLAYDCACSKWEYDWPTGELIRHEKPY
jgi:nitrite reductase/ring-hydroxylating ferredoxin subunit